MKIRSVGAIGFAFFLAVGAAACGDSTDPVDNGEGTPTADATASDDDVASGDSTVDASNGAAESNEAGDDASGPDESDAPPEPVEEDRVVEPVNPCDPNPCTAPPAAMCNESGVVVSYAADVDGTCTVVDDEASCEYEAIETTCEGDEFCAAGACVAPGLPEDYVFSADASVITSLGLAEDDATTPDVDEGDCCFDFNGDGEPDNGLGGLLASLGSFLGDSLGDDGVNGLIQEQIDDGTLTILFEQVGLDSAADDDALTLNGFFGEMAEGGYAVDPSSFIEGTSTPYIMFDNAMIAGGELTAGPSLFSVTIPLGEFGFDIALDAADTQIWSNVTAGDAGGLNWTDGILGGVVPMQQLVDALNGLGNSCDCLGLDGSDMLELKAEDKLGCTPALSGASPTCTEEADGSLCVGIADNKGLVCTAIGIIKPDIDTDLSGKKDSFSLGLRFEGAPAVITGLVAADDAETETDEGDGE
ncbi:MAG: hypothetical protein ACPGU1_11905 [Myxococcota bacterium]